jgi:hypothetical protein
MTVLDMVQVPRAVSSRVDGVRVASREAVYVLVVVVVPRKSNLPFLLPLRLHVAAGLPKVRFNTTSRGGTLSCRRDGGMMALFILANEDAFV